MSVSYYKGKEIPEMNYNITLEAKLQEKAIDITVNGSTVISPDSNYDALSGVTVNVNVPSSGGGESSGVFDLGSIGYSESDVPDSWREGLEYAEEIKENWDSSKTSMMEKYKEDTNLIFFPKVDTSKVSDMEKCFYNCFFLTTIPLLDTSNVWYMSYCFYGCSKLTTIPELNTIQVTNMSYCFYGCSSLTTIPELDTHRVTRMSSCFYGCSKLTTIPELDTSNVTIMNGCFESCSKLKRIEGISFKNMDSISNYSKFIFGYSYNIPCSYILIKDIGTKSACTTIDTTYARVWGINDEDNPDARQSLIDSLLTYSFDRRSAGYNDCTIKLYSTVKALLTTDEIDAIQAKGYIIS